jgi:hypothetical protein
MGRRIERAERMRAYRARKDPQIFTGHMRVLEERQVRRDFACFQQIVNQLFTFVQLHRGTLADELRQ